MVRSSIALSLATVVALFLASGPGEVRAQATASATPAAQRIAGSVLDQSGGAVPAAEVIVASASGARVVVVADETGQFVVNAAGAGPFTVTASAPGFAPTVETDVNGSAAVTLTVRPATVQERVEVVSSTRPTAVTSSATRTATPLLELPQTIDVVGALMLREQAATSLGDAMRNVQGVNPNLGEGRRDQFLIRGFSAQNDTLLDGTRDDAPYYRDVATLERIEVVKGPAAALFGRGSSGGVINRILKTPRPDEAIADASISLGTGGTRRFTGDLGRTNGQSLSFRVAAAAEDSASFRDDFFLKRVTLASSVLWTGASTTVLGQLELLDDRRVPDRGIPSINGRPADVRIGQTYGYSPDDFIDSSVVSGSVRIERRMARGWLLRQVARVGTYDTSFSNTAAAGTTSAAGAWRVARQQYNTEQSQQNSFSQSEVIVGMQSLGIRHLVLGGVELGVQQRNMIRFNGTAATVSLVDPVLTRPVYSSIAATYNRFMGTTTAVYAQDQLSIGTMWKALVGVRGDRYLQALDDRRPDDKDLERTDVNWSPRVGVVFQPTSATSLYGTVSRSFQPSGEGLSLAANAAELEPELSRNIEAGAKAELFGRRATVTLSLFRLDRRNIKTTDPVDPTRLVLVGAQRTNGAEVAFEGHLSARLRGQLGYALLDAAVLRSNTVTSGVLIEGNRPGLVPRHAANFWLHYDLTSRLVLAGGLTANGLRYTSNDNLVELPGYLRADAAISYRAGRVDLALNARNLSGARYYESASSNFQILPGAPRDLVFTVRVAR